jgi:hypothetical protein
MTRISEIESIVPTSYCIRDSRSNKVYSVPLPSLYSSFFSSLFSFPEI